LKDAKCSQAAIALKSLLGISKLRDSRPPVAGTLGGAHSDPLKAATSQAGAAAELDELSQMNEQQRRGMRYQKFRNLGVFTEVPPKVLVHLRLVWYNLLVFCNNFFSLLSLKRLRFCQYPKFNHSLISA